MKTRRATVLSLLAAVAVLMIVEVGCKGDSVTNPPPPPTPTPVPANFAGEWSGTAHALMSCQDPATALIVQQGSTVSGTLSTEGQGRCALPNNLAFSGSVEGSSFTGTITGSPQTQVGGTLSGANLSIMVRHLVVGADSMNVAMDLHR